MANGAAVCLASAARTDEQQRRGGGGGAIREESSGVLKVSAVDEEMSSKPFFNKSSFMCGARNSSHKNIDSGYIEPRVFLLDGTENRFKTNIFHPARHLLEQVCSFLKMNESEIFGLYFRDFRNRKIWLNMSKPLNKQIKNTSPGEWIFVFRVKFYPSDIGHISEDITRFYLTLQVRNDMVTRRLQASFNVCVAMAAYIVQSEVGDYSKEEHGESCKYIEDFNFIPDQSHDFLDRVCEAHKTLRGFEPTETDAKLLSISMKLSLYGQHTQPVVDKIDNSELTLAVNFSGLTVYFKKLIRNFFPWQMINRIHSKGKLLHIDVKCDLNNSNNRTRMYVYRMANERVNDEFLNLVIEHHIFFRLKDPNETVFDKNISFVGKANYAFSGQTMHRKWNDQIRREKDAENHMNVGEVPFAMKDEGGFKPTNTSLINSQSTPTKNACNDHTRSQKSLVLPIIQIDDVQSSFDLRNFDSTFNDRCCRTNRKEIEREITVIPNESTPCVKQILSSDPPASTIDHIASKSKTLSIHTMEARHHSTSTTGDEQEKEEADGGNRVEDVKGTNRSIPISIQQNSGVSSSKHAGAARGCGIEDDESDEKIVSEISGILKCFNQSPVDSVEHSVQPSIANASSTALPTQQHNSPAAN